MKPVGFPEQNKVYVAPKNWNAEQNGECGDLPVHKTPTEITSCWELDDKEQDLIFRGGHVYLTIMSDGAHPVVSLEVR